MSITGSPYLQTAYDRLILLRYDGQGMRLVDGDELATLADGTHADYDPMALITGNTPPRRAATMLPDG